MSDWFTTAMRIQEEAVRAQLEVAEKIHKANQKAAEANLAAIKEWLKLWGWK